MLQILKYSEIPEDKLATIHIDNFKCYKCGCTDVEKLYALCITCPCKDDTSKMEYIADCYCDDCCPFDMLTEFSKVYYLPEECNKISSQEAQLMLMAGISKKEIVKKILNI